MLKKLLISTIGLSLPLIASADDWVKADMVSYEPKGSSYTICYYHTRAFFSQDPDFSFSITIRGSSCPHSVEYNPITREWRE